MHKDTHSSRATRQVTKSKQRRETSSGRVSRENQRMASKPKKGHSMHTDQYGNAQQTRNHTHHFTPTRVTIILKKGRKKEETRVGEDTNDLEPSFEADGNAEWHNHSGQL